MTDWNNPFRDITRCEMREVSVEYPCIIVEDTEHSKVGYHHFGDYLVLTVMHNGVTDSVTIYPGEGREYKTLDELVEWNVQRVKKLIDYRLSRKESK